MPNFKFVISSGNRSWQVEKDQKECPISGKKIGESISADFLGLDGYELQITGGSDKDGFPMRKDIESFARKKIVVAEGVGFHPDAKGMRKRKIIRGNSVSEEIIQINCKVAKSGPKPLEEILGVKEKKEEAPKE